MDGIPNESERDFRARSQQRLLQISELAKRDTEEGQRRRQEGRPLGKLTDTLVSRLRHCNPKQLKTVIELCHRFEADHKIPPLQTECFRRAERRVLVSMAVGNRRYQWERQSCGKNCSKCPNHGPYLYVYARDGAFFPPKSLGAYPFKEPVPRKIKKAIREFDQSERAAAKTMEPC